MSEIEVVVAWMVRDRDGEYSCLYHQEDIGTDDAHCGDGLPVAVKSSTAAVVETYKQLESVLGGAGGECHIAVLIEAAFEAGRRSAMNV